MFLDFKTFDLTTQRSMAPAPPTRREVFIVAILLAILTFFSNREPLPSLEVALPEQVTLSSSTEPHHLESHKPRPIDSMVTWGPSHPPDTTIIAHVPGPSLSISLQVCRLTVLATGWTLFEQLYVFKGTIYIVSDNPSSVPDLQFISSKGAPISEGKQAEESRLPTPNDIQIIGTKRAKQLFGGKGAQVIEGFSVRLISSQCFLKFQTDLLHSWL